MTKEQISKIISIVIMAAIALLAVFGYDVGIVQPEFRAVRGEQPQAAGSQAVLGPYYENLNVGKDFKSFGTATLSSATVTTLTATTIVSQAIGFESAGNGTVGAPAYTFASDPDSGVYRIGANDLGVGVAGANVLDVNAAGLSVTGVITASGGLIGDVTGDLTGDVAAAEVTTSGGLTVTGPSVLNGGLTMDTSKFTVADTSGNTEISGTLLAAGAATVGSLTTAGDVASRNITATGSLVITGTSKLIGDITSYGTISATGTTALGNVTMGGIALTGPCVYGAESNVVDNTGIAHGLGSAPTAVFITPKFSTQNLTQTVYISGTANTTVITVGLGYATGVTTVPVVYWQVCQ